MPIPRCAATVIKSTLYQILYAVGKKREKKKKKKGPTMKNDDASQYTYTYYTNLFIIATSRSNTNFKYDTM